MGAGIFFQACKLPLICTPFKLVHDRHVHAANPRLVQVNLIINVLIFLFLLK